MWVMIGAVSCFFLYDKYMNIYIRVRVKMLVSEQCGASTRQEDELKDELSDCKRSQALHWTATREFDGTANQN